MKQFPVYKPCKPVLLMLAIAFLGVFAQCSNKQPLVGSWQMEVYLINGNDATTDMTLTWEFLIDGTFRQHMQFPAERLAEEARWFLDEGNMLRLEYPGNPSPVYWKIEHLNRNQLSVEYTRPGFLVIRKFSRLK